MKNKKLFLMCRRAFFLPALTGLSLLTFSPSFSQSPTARAVDGERATCKVTAEGKERLPQLNQIGSFDQISNVPGGKPVKIECSYPNGRKDDNVVISLEDGGKLDNGKTVKVVHLDDAKKFAFTFTASRNNPGIYRITIRKGNDEKTIRLWVD